MSDDQHVPPVDWDRYKVHGSGGGDSGVPVGDPTRWGVELLTPLTDAPATVLTPQILQMSTRDGYSRSWSMLGTLSLPTVLWDANELGPGQQILVELQIGLGVGQSTINHAILLVSPIGFTVTKPSVPAGGLCMQQNWSNGGPYNTLFDSGAGNESRPFAIIGGLIGKSISVRARYTTFAPQPITGLPAASRLALIVTPYAAGEGL